ncbi:MAG: hypothetical protein AAGF12_05290 [Myxococcota bacterium]
MRWPHFGITWLGIGSLLRSFPLLAVLPLAAGCISTVDPNLTPRNGYIRPQSGSADPIVQQGIALGTVSLSDGRLAASGCRGFVTKEPSFVLELMSEQPFLRIFTESHLDTMLMIRMPNGQFVCDDNSIGWNPQIQGRFRSGVYAIWVGGTRRDLNASYNLGITRRQDVTSTGGPPAALPPR